MIKPKDLLHELEQGERIAEDLKKFLMRMNSVRVTGGLADWTYASSTSIYDTFVMPWSSIP